MANSNKKSLSKNLSQMKFMKRRSHDPAAMTLGDSTVGALIEKWVVPDVPDIPNDSSGHHSLHAYVESFVECEQLNPFGRYSYNKFNKEVERLSRLYADGNEPLSQNEADDEDGTIPAHEMARRYEEITSRKLLGKRKRTVEDDLDAHHKAEGGAVGKGRYKELQKRVDKMDKKGFLKPS